jgi:glycerate kinase
VLLAVGGSATCDGGAGCLQALGVRLLDSHGEELRAGIGGGELERIAGIDAAQARIALQQVQLEVLCDVRNPMVGPHGSARVYAPQKGATPAQVEVLERGLVHFARIIANHLGVQIANMPHAGAAGGLAGGLCGMLGARLRPGAEFVLDWIGFDAKVRAADAVITGEGRLDDQSLSGKMVQAVARQARLLGIPTYVLAGSVALSRAAVKEHFVDAAGIENTSSATPFEALRALARQQAPMWFSAAQS